MCSFGRPVDCAEGGRNQAACANIEKILNDDVPVAIPYFYNYLSGNAKTFTGVYTSALGQMFLSSASKA